MVMNHCLIDSDGKTILKRYLDPSQCIASKRSQLKKILFWSSDLAKNKLEYKEDKKTITHEGKQYDVDGEVKIKA